MCFKAIYDMFIFKKFEFFVHYTVRYDLSILTRSKLLSFLHGFDAGLVQVVFIKSRIGCCEQMSKTYFMLDLSCLKENMHFVTKV